MERWLKHQLSNRAHHAAAPLPCSLPLTNRFGTAGGAAALAAAAAAASAASAAAAAAAAVRPSLSLGDLLARARAVPHSRRWLAELRRLLRRRLLRPAVLEALVEIRRHVVAARHMQAVSERHMQGLEAFDH